MVIILAFQAKDDGSIPFTRSNRLGRLERGSSRQEGGRPAPQLPQI